MEGDKSCKTLTVLSKNKDAVRVEGGVAAKIVTAETLHACGETKTCNLTAKTITVTNVCKKTETDTSPPPTNIYSLKMDDASLELTVNDCSVINVDFCTKMVNISCFNPTLTFVNFHNELLEDIGVDMPTTICLISIPETIVSGLFVLGDLDMGCCTTACIPQLQIKKVVSNKYSLNINNSSSQDPKKTSKTSSNESKKSNNLKSSSNPTISSDTQKTPFVPSENIGIICKLSVVATLASGPIFIDIGNGLKISLELVGHNAELLWLPNLGYYQYISGSFLPIAI